LDDIANKTSEQKLISGFATDINVDGLNDLIIVLKSKDNKIEIKAISQNSDKSFKGKNFLKKKALGKVWSPRFQTTNRPHSNSTTRSSTDSKLT
jgi:hypothetical protein